MRILIGISLNFQCGSGLIQNLKKWGNYPLFPWWRAAGWYWQGRTRSSPADPGPPLHLHQQQQRAITQTYKHYSRDVHCSVGWVCRADVLSILNLGAFKNLQVVLWERITYTSISGGSEWKFMQFCKYLLSTKIPIKIVTFVLPYWEKLHNLSIANKERWRFFKVSTFRDGALFGMPPYVNDRLQASKNLDLDPEF